jgi:hypothetical protein
MGRSPTTWLGGLNRMKAKTFKIGDHVTWNSEAGRVSGRIVKCIRKM